MDKLTKKLLKKIYHKLDRGRKYKPSKLINNRQKQVYAAVCFKLYADKFAIAHRVIDEFIRHMCCILITDNLTTWEEKIGELEICSLYCLNNPAMIIYLKEKHKKNWQEFTYILSSCSQIVSANMYGGSAKHANTELQHVIDILKKHHIELPNFRPIKKLYTSFKYTQPRVSNITESIQIDSKKEFLRLIATNKEIKEYSLWCEPVDIEDFKKIIKIYHLEGLFLDI